MIIAAHTIVGGVAGEWIGNPALAFLIGIVLHFVLDSIPHYDTVEGGCWTWKQIVFTGLDFLLMFYLLFAIVKLPLDRTILNSSFAWGAFGGMVPDLLDNVPFWQKKFRSFQFGKSMNAFHYRIQPKQPSFLYGMATQVAVIFLALLLHFAIIK